MLEDPGRFYWKWLAVGTVLLAVYFVESGYRYGDWLWWLRAWL